MSNINACNSYFQISGKDHITNLAAFKVPASSPEGEGEFIISITGNGATSSITLSDNDAFEFISQLNMLICNSETDRLKEIYGGQDLPPLSPPLQNLLKHIQKSVADSITEKK